jgi:1-acyl-sn-glycerol-3-phosphate acyltransferase
MRGLPDGPIQRVARAMLRWAGWHLVGEAPDVPRCVVIFAPHTSTWDFPLLLCVRAAFGRSVSYLAKSTLFRFPIAWLLRKSGAIPVDRTERQDLVQTLVEIFQQRQELWIALSPEGTRDRTDHWKSGFYHLAREAGVPLLLGFIDAEKRECGFGGLLELTGDVAADMDRLRAFYANKRGIRPECESEIRLLHAEDAG